MRSRFPIEGVGGCCLACWLIIAAVSLPVADICIGFILVMGGSADCLAFRCPSLDAGTGRFYGSGIDSCLPAWIALFQSYGSSTAFIIISINQSGLCGFGTAELVQVYASPPEHRMRASVKAVDDIEDHKL